MDSRHPILVGDVWTPAHGERSFQATNPATGDLLPDQYPISDWHDCETILDQAHEAFVRMVDTPVERISDFLVTYADLLTADADSICRIASLETGLPVSPRLRDVELARTTNQLRQAASAALDGSWRLAAIDTQYQLRSMLSAVGPVVVFGPNNFPLAFNAVSGGDFATAIAAGNPVIAKAHPLQPTTSRKLAELAAQAAAACRLPPGTIQMMYHLEPEDGLRLVRDRRVGAVGFTGGRPSGLKLKAACDSVGKPVYLEMSSLNPVIVLPGALRERLPEIAQEFCDSCLMAAGQMCTNPGLVLLIRSTEALQLQQQVAEQLHNRTPGILFSAAGRDSLHRSVQAIVQAGAELIVGGYPLPEPGFRYANTLLTCSADQFLSARDAFQVEMFGSASLIVYADDDRQLSQVIASLEGNLTGSMYSSRTGEDESLYARLAPVLRQRVGRLNNDKMPTGVVVSPAMCHGGPYPSTGHPGFTAVGIPGAMRRFAMLQCYDRVRPERLPNWLADANPNGRCWRWVDDQWTTADVGAAR